MALIICLDIKGRSSPQHSSLASLVFVSSFSFKGIHLDKDESDPPIFGATANAATLAAKGAAACCDTLQQQLPGKVFLPNSPEYQEQQSSYYPALASQHSPACRVTPTSAQDVSTTLQTLKAGECQFAVRSGGHMQYNNSNNIDMVGMNALDISADKKVIGVGPGNRWGAVYDALAPDDLVIVGGRSNTVGVGGYLLGGWRYVPLELSARFRCPEYCQLRDRSR
uniref:FAD linked oxidase N-terminal domain-containing protein n=1 Tax=Moniliophthora roreri TaxID=221103 RepID=A0A0W0F5G4_MONRR